MIARVAGHAPYQALYDLGMNVLSRSSKRIHADYALWGGCIDEFRDAGFGGAELSVLALPELAGLEQWLDEPGAGVDLARLAYISVHGPAKSLDGDWLGLVRRLRRIADHQLPVLLHPDTFPDDAEVWEALRGLGSSLVIENMDVRKSRCRTAAELRPVLRALPEARLCLDVAHAWTIDPTLDEALRILELAGDRLQQLHLSGIELTGQHRQLTVDDVARYARVLPEATWVPWVDESPG